MSKTRNDLIARALGVLRVLAAGQSPSAEDVAMLDAVIDGVVASLRARDIVYIGDLSEIEDEYFEPLAVCVAHAAHADFGRPAETLPSLARAEADFELMTRGRPTYARVSGNYF